MNLGILNLGLLNKDIDPHVSLHQTILEAQHADAIGFSRYWLAEHYGDNCAWTYSLPLAGILLASTKKICIGTGGVLLRHHQPYRVACDAKFLNSTYPDRFELGLGRGSAEYPWNTVLPTTGSDYNQQIEELLGHLQYKSKVYNGQTFLNALPAKGISPKLWMLASGHHSIKLAEHFGLPLCMSLFHSQDLPENITHNMNLFLAIAGSCGESKTVAESQLQKEDLFFWPKVIGNGNECLLQLECIRQHYNADGVIFAELVNDHNYRMNSMNLLAAAAAQGEPQIQN